MAFIAAATVAPLFYVDESFNDQAHHILVTLPVMVVSAGVVRYLRETLARRELQYRRFAVEAVTLAERIRGGPRSPGDDLENVEERLAELAPRRAGPRSRRGPVSRVKRRSPLQCPRRNRPGARG